MISSASREFNLKPKLKYGLIQTSRYNLYFFATPLRVDLKINTVYMKKENPMQ